MTTLSPEASPTEEEAAETAQHKLPIIDRYHFLASKYEEYPESTTSYNHHDHLRFTNHPNSLVDYAVSEVRHCSNV